MTNQSAAVVRRGRKFDQVLDGARKVFLADGFEGASVDDIAREAGVSKATLYSYFPDKRLLFMEVARNECARHATRQSDIPEGSSPRQVLTLVARHILSVILSDVGQKIYRICVAETERFPDLGREFFASGPQMEREKLKSYLRTATARGELQIEDFDMATEQWAALLRTDLFPRMIFNLRDSVAEAEIHRVADATVDMFLARYGV
ncbi:TetR/AcrR family transcriptional regulator [Epibacterium sp. DP7N7-1]|uniref:TetR family transcriptional regulator n=1 Tax=Tritonibacter mobilis F1926 TaxID=1265309 RepID=A0A1B1A7T2_9RHOB|nr:TetR/AcrR family transcriptional regulator [Tritonibacter mobilis]MBW3244865.1 TetR/AcrR family transcriptional regulator [Epibacterium sp. DP7N7-1]ANP42635.1 TetR family transcriptional regulator [Tritonibacter mobilis F1926]KJZ21339.1 TetR family transcriptional regulator [Tritonibacter mobilis]MBU3034054.1 TetR/AcrR family transcriptional regulator [Tritonibacter mobilis]MCA2008357.1 TetR/AcrR family transcriptional regulator [Tritonibacter mobilis]